MYILLLTLLISCNSFDIRENCDIIYHIEYEVGKGV